MNLFPFSPRRPGLTTHSTRSRRARNAARPGLELLEGRQLLSTVTDALNLAAQVVTEVSDRTINSTNYDTGSDQIALQEESSVNDTVEPIIGAPWDDFWSNTTTARSDNTQAATLFDEAMGQSDPLAGELVNEGNQLLLAAQPFELAARNDVPLIAQAITDYEANQPTTPPQPQPQPQPVPAPAPPPLAPVALPGPTTPPAAPVPTYVVPPIDTVPIQPDVPGPTTPPSPQTPPQTQPQTPPQTQPQTPTFALGAKVDAYGIPTGSDWATYKRDLKAAVENHVFNPTKQFVYEQGDRATSFKYQLSFTAEANGRINGYYVKPVSTVPTAKLPEAVDIRDQLMMHLNQLDGELPKFPDPQHAPLSIHLYMNFNSEKNSTWTPNLKI